jgi:hypothetical protein
MIELAKVISNDFNSNILILQLIETKEHLKYKITNKQIYSPNAIVVLKNGIIVNSKKYKKYVTEYTKKQKFYTLIKYSSKPDVYKEYVAKENIDYETFYRHIYLENKPEEKLLIKKIEEHYYVKKKIIFELEMPLYQKDLLKIFENLEQQIFYLDRNKFYIILKSNTLFEKSYNTFYKMFKHIKQIKLDNLQIV